MYTYKLDRPEVGFTRELVEPVIEIACKFVKEEDWDDWDLSLWIGKVDQEHARYALSLSNCVDAFDGNGNAVTEPGFDAYDLETVQLMFLNIDDFEYFVEHFYEISGERDERK